jgi:Zn-dependent peptidase ImmA (M78 family)
MVFSMDDPVCFEAGATHFERFNPRRLACDRNGIPFLSRQEIESAAVGFLWDHCPWVLAAPKVTPVLDILDQLKLQTGLLAKFVELGHKGADKVLGRLRFRHRLLYLDSSLAQERESGFRFALAHEIGHWVLHRYNFERWKSPDLDTRESAVENPVDGLFPFRRRTPAESMEFQARTFAAALLMPHRTFTSAFFQLRQEFSLSMESTRDNFENLVLCLSDTFQVSKTCVRIRIEELKLLAHEVFESLAGVPIGERDSAPIDHPSLSTAFT